MLERLDLTDFKGFPRFSVTFSEENFLVGPNNAGKSTVISALRVASQMLRIARRKKPDRDGHDGDHVVPAYGFSSRQVHLVDENLRHEFRGAEARIEVKFKGGSRLVAVWPADDIDSPDDPEDSFFYLRTADGVNVRRSAQVRDSFPTLTVLPQLAPVEHEERVLESQYVKENWGSRLASRHFRNQLYLMQHTATSESENATELDEFLAWAKEWTPDFTIGELRTRPSSSGRLLDLFCREVGSQTERELFWAGDGVQIWLQLLMHIFRAQGAATVVLDEPDLYLHADLQRRLVRLLEAVGSQSVAASHSAELLGEAAPRAVIWVSRARQRAVRAPDEKTLAELSSSLGSQFNLRLARTLRANAVLFVEGQDAKILRNFARTLNAFELTSETRLVTLPLRGYTNWDQIEPFAWMSESLLGGSVAVRVVLDRDYRSNEQVAQVVARLERIGVACHVWSRKELESYVLIPSAIAKLSGASVGDVERELARLADDARHKVFARVLSERLSVEVKADRHRVDVTEAAQSSFELLWEDVAARPYMCNAKDLLSGLNRWLAAGSHKTVSARGIAARAARHEIPAEMVEVILAAEAMVASA